MIQVERYGPVIALRMARRFLGRPLYWATAYWIDGLLIDTGPAVTARELVRVLEQVPVRQIALTHGHEDHMGGLAALRRRYPDIPVYASARTAEFVEMPELLQMQLYRRAIWGAPEAVTPITVLDEVDDVLHTPRYSLRAVETPGHSRDHVCYFEPQQRWLFSGDALIGGRDRTWAREYELFGVVGSLQTMVTLQPDRLFPGSGNVRRNPTNDMLDKINYLTQLARDVGKLEVDGVKPEAIAAQLFGADSGMAFWTQRHFTGANLVEACRIYNSIVESAPGPRPHPVVDVSDDDPNWSDPAAPPSPDLGDVMH